MTLADWSPVECPHCGETLLLPAEWLAGTPVCWIACACGCAFEYARQETAAERAGIPLLNALAELGPHRRCADTPEAANVHAVPAGERCDLTPEQDAAARRLLASVALEGL